MSSGLEFNENYDNPISDVNNMLLGNHRSMVDFAAAKTLIAEPDTLWQYSTGTANLLGAVIRNSLNNQIDYQNFARIELFDKLDMKTAIIESDQRGNIVTGAYMWASPRDWARFGLFCLQNGRWENEQILPEHWMKYATTPTPSDPAAPYGAQFWLNSKKSYYPSLPADLYECRGKDIQRVTIIPSQKLIVARFGYTPDASGWDHEQFVGKVIQIFNPQSKQN
jgi:CubicO group peptidase (beta-lactamase class C family)